MIDGSLTSSYGWGYTLYYTTNFIFTGLAVSVAFHARMFNIGGEGQAMIGGLGVALVCLAVPWPHWTHRTARGASRRAALFGRRSGAAGSRPISKPCDGGSHIVITTIMFKTSSQFSVLNSPARERAG